MTNFGNMQINADRLWTSLMEMAKIGATEKGGNARLALTDLDRDGRDLFVRWCKEAGCTVTIDSMGNIFARRPGLYDHLPPIATGSHLDTQPTGGKFDGVYGVLAGLEVIRTLNDNNFRTERPIEVAVWTNEEGARFAPAMVASGVFAGVFTEEYGLSRTDSEGRKLGDELTRIGYRGDEPAGKRKFGAFFEAHIEQGPILEAEAKTIGVVLGIQGMRWFEINITGMESHAGTTPMKRRRDAGHGCARIIERVHQIAMESAGGLGTVGIVSIKPGSRNTIPGSAFLTVDLRHPDEQALFAMKAALDSGLEDISQALHLSISCTEIWHSPAVRYNSGCIDTVRQSAQKAGYSHMDIVSGAGHDAGYISRVAPTAMIFIPCADGISHNEIEAASPEHVGAGCNVLLHAMLDHAQRLPETGA